MVNNTIQPIHYGGFWIRFLAFLIDSLLLMAIFIPLLRFIYGTVYFINPPPNPDYNPLSLILTWLLPAIVILLFWRYKSATPGKMVFRLVIVDADTLQQPSISQLVIRYLGYILSALPLYLGFLWIAFDKRKQGWHDKLARTVVICRPRPV